jgi:hypothetical protein
MSGQGISAPADGQRYRRAGRRSGHMEGDVMVKRCFAGALVLLAVAAGCGGDDDEDAAPATSTAAAAGATASSAAAPASTTGTSAAAATTAAGGGAPAQPTCKPVGNMAEASTTVAYELNEFKVTGPASAPAGSIGFQLTNVGRAGHELEIFKADSYDSMPKNQYGTVDVAQLPAGTEVGEVERFPGGGQTCSGVFDLDPGNYVLICNIEFQNGPEVVSHAGRGMVMSFEVTG